MIQTSKIAPFWEADLLGSKEICLRLPHSIQKIFYMLINGLRAPGRSEGWRLGQDLSHLNLGKAVEDPIFFG